MGKMQLVWQAVSTDLRYRRAFQACLISLLTLLVGLGAIRSGLLSSHWDWLLLVLPVGVVSFVAGGMAGSRERHWILRSQRDPLTGLHTMNWFQTRLVQECARARRQGYPVSLLALQLNDLEDINRRFGPEAGDRLLLALAEHLRLSVREEEVLARAGGARFVVLLYNCTAEQADLARMRLQDRMSSVRVLGDAGLVLPNKVSAVAVSAVSADCRGDRLWRMVRQQLRSVSA